jgi:hypothetical protein
MNSRQLEKFLGEMCPRSEADLDVRGRKLRDSGDLPIGGRGPHAPELDERHGAKWLLGMCGTKKAVDAAAAVKEFSALVPVGGASKGFAAAPDFLTAVAAAVKDYAAATTVKRIVFWHKPEYAPPHQQWFASAEVTWEAGGREQTTLYAPARIAKEIAEHSLTWGTIMHDCTVIGTALLCEIGARLAGRDDGEDEPAGWADDEIGRQAAEQFRKAARRQAGNDDDDR